MPSIPKPATTSKKILKSTKPVERPVVYVVVDANRKAFKVYAGPTKSRVYSGAVPYEILTAYFDGLNAVIQCEKKTYVFGPADIRNPKKNWRLIRQFN